MIAGLAMALSLAGTAAGVVGSVMQYKGAQKAEKARQGQMREEANRARREQIRLAQVNRAKATAAAFNQGAEGTSALVGAQSAIANTGARNVNAINADEKFNNQIFSANRQIAKGSLVSGLGSGLQSLGGAIGSNAGTITRIGNSIAPKYFNAETAQV